MVNVSLCISCGACERACPILNEKNNDALTKAYAALSKDESLRLRRVHRGNFFGISQGSFTIGLDYL